MIGTEDRKRFELISCDLPGWACKVLFKTDHAIQFPVETSAGSVIFSASPLREGRYRPVFADFDFYLAGKDGNVRQLSDSHFYQLRSLSAVGDHILFSALGGHGIPDQLPSAESASDIFEVGFDPIAEKLLFPDGMLKPLFSIGGYSIAPAASADGKFVAFLNTPPHIGPYRYDLVIAERGGEPVFRSAATETGLRRFSQPTFVGDDVFAFQIVAGTIKVTKIDARARTSAVVADIDISEWFLDSLPRLDVTTLSE